MDSRVLTDDLDFERDGAVRVRGAFDPDGMADVLWSALASRHRILKEEPATWPVGFFGKLTKLGKSGRFAAIATDRLATAISGLLGVDWHDEDRWGQPLITFPVPLPWDVPNAWHTDGVIEGTAASPATIRMFAYLTSVAPGGGGTTIIAGAHHLAAQRLGYKSAELRRELASVSPWFRDLWDSTAGDRVGRFMTDGDEVEGVHVRVVELTGEPGDVVLWHPSLLHAGTTNALDVPRFMLTNTARRDLAQSPT